jgi:hypothetical protein
MRKINKIILVMIMTSSIFLAIKTSHIETYAEEKNFTKFTLADIEAVSKPNHFILEVQNASSVNPQITEFRISGDNNQICKSGVCTYHFNTMNISLPTPEYTGLTIHMNFQQHNVELQKMELHLLAVLSGINDTNENNIIYEFNDYLNNVRLNPTENPIDKSIDENEWYKWYLDNTWYYATNKVEYREGEDRLIVIGKFHGNEPRDSPGIADGITTIIR